jgi:hypothetical protein
MYLRRCAWLVLGLAVVSPLTASAGLPVYDSNKDDPDHNVQLEVGGFAQGGYFDFMTWDPVSNEKSGVQPLNGFLLQRARLNARGQATKFFVLSLEVELAGGQASLQDAYLESRPFQWLKLRVGQFLVPFLQTYQFNEVNTSFEDRELYVPQTQLRHPVAALTPRDIGVMVFGTVGDMAPSSTMPVLEYSLGIFNGQGSNDPSHTDGVFLYAARLQLDVLGYPQGRYSESDFARNLTPRIAVGLGGMMNCDTEGNWNRGFTADAELRWRGLYASASFVWLKNSGGGGPGDGFASEFGYAHHCPGGGTPAYLSSGGHVQVQYLTPWLAIEQGGGLEFLGRWDQVSPYNAPTSFIGTSDPAQGGFPIPSQGDAQLDDLPSRWRLTFGVNWYPLHRYAFHLSANFQFEQNTTPVQLPEQQLAYLQNGVLWIQGTVGL